MWLLSNFFLSMNVCCSNCHSGVPRKWRTWKNSLSMWDFPLNRVEVLQKLSRLWKLAFGEQTIGRTQVFEWFSKFKSGVTTVKDVERTEHPSLDKTDKVWNKWRNLTPKIEVTVHEVADVLECIWLCSQYFQTLFEHAKRDEVTGVEETT
jgi:hypothetical protein